MNVKKITITVSDESGNVLEQTTLGNPGRYLLLSRANDTGLPLPPSDALNLSYVFNLGKAYEFAPKPQPRETCFNCHKPLDNGVCNYCEGAFDAYTRETLPGENSIARHELIKAINDDIAREANNQ